MDLALLPLLAMQLLCLILQPLRLPLLTQQQALHSQHFHGHRLGQHLECQCSQQQLSQQQQPP